MFDFTEPEAYLLEARGIGGSSERPDFTDLLDRDLDFETTEICRFSLDRV